MDSDPFVVDVRLNGTDFVTGLVDSGCLATPPFMNNSFDLSIHGNDDHGLDTSPGLSQITS
jgi:hypothetical protein